MMISFKAQGLYKYSETDLVCGPLPVDAGPLS